MSRLETLNDDMIRSNVLKEERFAKLKNVAKDTLERMNAQDFMKSVKRLTDESFIEAKERIQ